MAFNRPPPSPCTSDSPSSPEQSAAPSTRSRPAGDPGGAGALPPRVLIVMPAHWPRATLRAALREIGYDAIGTRSLSGALAYPAHVSGRGPVGAIIVDASPAAVSAGEVQIEDALGALVQRHGDVPLLLVASAVHADPAGPWTRVLRRPISIQQIVDALSDIVPLAPDLRGPVER